MPLDLKTLLKDNFVYFHSYRKGYLYYTITEPCNMDFIPLPLKVPMVSSSPKTYLFPVPLDDIGDATFNATEKALLFMRYIRKAQEEGSFVKALL